MLDVVSVDGYRLAVRREAIDFPEDLSFVVPGKTLGELFEAHQGQRGPGGNLRRPPAHPL